MKILHPQPFKKARAHRRKKLVKKKREQPRGAPPSYETIIAPTEAQGTDKPSQ